MYQHSTAFADTLDRCFSACSEMLTPSLREAMFNPDSAQLDNMAWAQPAIVAFEIAMAAHWRAEGLKPDFAIGHSVGEFAAAVVCGHYTIEQVMPLVCRRGALMQQCASGAMVAVFADEDTLMPLARQFELDLAANNGTQHTVFSGPEARLAVFCATLSQHDINYRRLSVTGAAHSALLEPILIGSRTPARDCTRSRGKYRLFPRSPPTSLMSQRSTRRITGADTCASRCVLSRVFRWRISSAPAFFWRWGPMPSWLLAGSANTAITHTG